MDIVIPYLLTHRTEELRFCLRSIDRYASNVGKIYLVGTPPHWLTGVETISCPDTPLQQFKERNIYRKIVKACEDSRISDNFCMMNDDHFLNAPTDIASLPNYYRGDLYTAMDKNHGTYRATVNNTIKYLRSKGLPTKDFDCHAPIIYNKEAFIKAFESVDWEVPFGYCIKSMYANSLGIEGEKATDCKLVSRDERQLRLAVQGRPWFSTGTAHEPMVSFLSGLYPRVSPYETGAKGRHSNLRSHL